MQYIQPIGPQGSGNGFGNGYVDKDAGAGIAGSFLSGKVPEHLQLELLNLIAKSGLVPNEIDLTQVAAAVRSQWLNYVLTAGTANALTATLNPPVTTHAQTGRMMLRLVPQQPNTAAATFNAGPGDLPILRMDGSPIQRGDLQPFRPNTVVGNGSAWILASVAYSEFRRSLRANLTIYINDAIGNDNNDGSANTAGGAFKTIQGAIDRIAGIYDTGSFTITLKCAAGTYDNTIFQTTRSLNLVLVGEPTDPSLVKINCPGGSAGVVAKEGCSVAVDGVELIGTGNGLDANNNGTIRYQNVHFSNTGTHVTANYASSATQTGPCVVKAASAPQHIFAGVTSSILTAFQTLTFADPVTWGVGFAVTGGGQAIVNGMTYFSVGNASGPRYFSNALGMIYVAGGGPNILPGSTAGSVALGGVYG